MEFITCDSFLTTTINYLNFKDLYLLSQVDKYLEEKLGGNLKKTTTAELQGKEELGAFWKEVGKNAQGPMVKSFEELQKSGMISQDALKGVKSIGSGEQQVTTKNINLNIKSNDAVVDATTRAIVNNPSIANDIANTVLPSELDYTSTTLPTKFY